LDALSPYTEDGNEIYALVRSFLEMIDALREKREEAKKASKYPDNPFHNSLVDMPWDKDVFEDEKAQEVPGEEKDGMYFL